MTDAADGQTRRKLVALVVLVGVAAALGAVAALTSGGGDAPAGGLRIERSSVQGSGAPQLIVYVDDPGANVAGTAGGRPNVELRCIDARDRVVVRATFPWPFVDTDQGTIEPHVHQNVSRPQAERIVGCRLAGTDGPLEGRVSAPGG